MKTIYSFFSVLAFTALLTSCGGSESATEESTSTTDAVEEIKETVPAPDGVYQLNTEKSQLMWEGTMLKIGGVSLYGHTGTIKFAKGEVKVGNGMVAGGTLVVDMKTITPTDENYNPEENRGKDNLVGHLSSKDFFAIEEHPTARIDIRGGNENAVKSQMTIRGVTNAEAITDLNISYDGGNIVYEGNMTIDRQKYNVAFEMPAEDKILSDEINLTFKVIFEPSM